MTTESATRRKRILGYADRLSVRPGDSLQFKISSDGDQAFTAQLVRLINGDTYSAAARFSEVEIADPVNGEYPGRAQAIYPGSCITVGAVDPMDGLDAITIVIGFRATRLDGRLQHLMSRWDAGGKIGWSLCLDEQRRLCFISAAAPEAAHSVTWPEPITADRWYRAAAGIDWRTGIVRLVCRAIDAGAPLPGRAISATVGDRPAVALPLVLAAGFGGMDASGRIIPAGCYDGRLEAPAIYRGCLTQSDVERLSVEARLDKPGEQLVADWDFCEAMSGVDVIDRSGSELNGRTHNLPLRAVKGSNWTGATMEWRHAPHEYGAIHFHSDDLYDCGWRTDIHFEVPDLRSGIYALRVRRGDAAATDIDEDYLPFFVAPPRSAPGARIALLIPTHSYVAYGNFHALEPERKRSGIPADEYYASPLMGPGTRDYAMLAEAHGQLGLSLYDRHRDGSPVHIASWLRPLLTMRPKTMLWTLGADLLIVDWLEELGFDHDILTDDLLEREGAGLLHDYRVVITGNHPEYVTTAGHDALSAYIGEGGRLLYLGGNGFYWRVATSPQAPCAIEVRRGRVGTGMWQSEVGESGLAFTGEVGGIWRELGRPPHRLLGIGFTAQGLGASHYRIMPDARTGPAAFALVGVDGDIVGDFGIFEGAAAGQEIDRSDAAQGSPADLTVIARSEGHGPGMLYAIEGMEHTYPVIDHYRGRTCAELTYFATPAGGAIFSVGSMAWCGSLSHDNYDNSVSRMTANVLRHMRDAGE